MSPQMLRLTLAQMRRSAGRLVAAGLAITLGTGFVAATLLAGGSMTRTVNEALTEQYAGADLVVTDGEVTGQTLGILAELPGVTSVHGHLELGLDLTGGTGRTFAQVTSAAVDPGLESAELAAGTLPTAPGEIAVSREVSELLGLEVGDHVDAEQVSWREIDEVDQVGQVSGDEQEMGPVRQTDRLTVVGVVDQPGAALLGTTGVGVVHPDQMAAWLDFQDPVADQTWYWYALVSVADDVSVADVQAMARDALTTDAAVRTIGEQARSVTTDVTGTADQLTAAVLGFAAVSLIVAALVITNTFQVLVAQRTRTLALLRCVGAGAGQLRLVVLVEGLALGLASSLLGVLLGTAAVQAALLVLRRSTDVPLPELVAVTPAVVVVPVGLGVLVTVLAVLGPAVAATRVSPLAALRPVEDPPWRPAAGTRAWIAMTLVLVGAALLALGPAASDRDALGIGLGMGLLGGALSFLGMVMGAVFWVPWVVARAGQALGLLGGTSARLAAANALRNPRRTASTSAALFIGVTLVAMMATGAASTRSALDGTLTQEFPVDVGVGAYSDGFDVPALPTGLPAAVRAIEGVEAVTTLTGVSVDLERADGTGDDTTGTMVVEARGVDLAEARTVMRAPEQLDGLGTGTVVVPATVASWYGIDDGDPLTLRRTVAPYVTDVTSTPGPSVSDGTTRPPDPTTDDGTEATDDGTGVPDDGAAEPRAALTLTAVVTDLTGTALIVTPSSVEALDPDAPTSRLWIRVADPREPQATVDAITEAASESGTSLETTGVAVQRAFYQRVVDTLLTVVLGLLAVAVVIALVGVANTLALSVIERRRESATLRALGMSRTQLRTTLAVEGMLTAGVGGLVGVLLGTAYGWVGVRILLGVLAPVALVVPWSALGVILVVAVLAGLLASVLPGRRASRTSPVAALAIE
ncbi:FtsX-like permease family protein [Actinotalea subterranea]|uniref:FtsX-like permease family protein n=1 Tax=Actinotalea subterranea TaxID=2607497 RepID=UPI001FEA8374|nr:ABC transporter permease [Actinotalea subterranea]